MTVKPSLATQYSISRCLSWKNSRVPWVASPSETIRASPMMARNGARSPSAPAGSALASASALARSQAMTSSPARACADSSRASALAANGAFATVAAAASAVPPSNTRRRFNMAPSAGRMTAMNGYSRGSRLGGPGRSTPVALRDGRQARCDRRHAEGVFVAGARGRLNLNRSVPHQPTGGLQAAEATVSRAACPLLKVRQVCAPAGSRRATRYWRLWAWCRGSPGHRAPTQRGDGATSVRPWQL